MHSNLGLCNYLSICSLQLRFRKAKQSKTQQQQQRQKKKKKIRDTDKHYNVTLFIFAQILNSRACIYKYTSQRIIVTSVQFKRQGKEKREWRVISMPIWQINLNKQVTFFLLEVRANLLTCDEQHMPNWLAKWTAYGAALWNKGQ